MRAKITVSVNPRVQSLSDLATLSTQDMATLTTRMDSTFRAHETALFATEGASGGSKWADLSEDYAEQKKRKFPGRKILQRTGRMRRSLAAGGDEHVATYALQPSATVTLGTEVETASYHTGRLKSPRMPERDPLQHTPEQERKYLQIAADYIAKVKLPRLLRALQAWSRSKPGRAA